MVECKNRPTDWQMVASSPSPGLHSFIPPLDELYWIIASISHFLVLEWILKNTN